MTYKHTNKLILASEPLLSGTREELIQYILNHPHILKNAIAKMMDMYYMMQKEHHKVSDSTSLENHSMG